MTVLINMFGAPGSGKSTIAAGLFHRMKVNGLECEYVPEFAKDLVWGERTRDLNDQIYIFGKQQMRINRLIDKVDYIINDSPLLLSIYYNGGKLKSLDSLVLEVHNNFNNLNYLLERCSPYNPNGRWQTAIEAEQVDVDLKNILKQNNIDFKLIMGNNEGLESIFNEVSNMGSKSETRI